MSEETPKDEQGPDLLGLAEIGARSLFDELADRLVGSFPNSLRIWEDSPDPDFTGLGLIGRDGKVARVSLVDSWRPVKGARPRILIMECELTSVTRPVFLVVNHWKSRLQYPNPTGLTDYQDRREAADWLGRRLGLA